MKSSAWKYFKGAWWGTLLITIVSLASTLLLQMVYKFIGYIIDYGLNYNGKGYSGVLSFLFSGKFGDYGSKKLTISLCVSLIIIVFLKTIFAYLQPYLQMKFQYGFSHKLRKAVFYEIKGKKSPYSSGSMINLYLDDLYQHGNVLFSIIPSIIVTVGTTAFCLSLLGDISPYLLIAPISLSPLLIYFSVKYHKEIYQRNVDYREIDGDLKNSVDASLFTDDKEKYNEFLKINKEHLKERKVISNVPNKYNVILNSVKVGIYIISCTIAGVLAIKGKVLIGEYLIFTTFVNTIYTQILSFISNVISIRANKPKLEKVEKILEGSTNE